MLPNTMTSSLRLLLVLAQKRVIPKNSAMLIDEENESSDMISHHIHSQKRASCSKSATGLLPCCHQADIRMCSHRLPRLDDSSSTSCQQAWCKLIVKTFYPQI